ncbi:contractile injection system protein, VgrG/Pvc8 family [Thiosocius teredinicola]|uniref:contractile injection system protein, VgrG/Pvc8 family n=1 Tax=Thiosocius teredinicola TaxID=1973002 RepID=UPI0038CD4B6A
MHSLCVQYLETDFDFVRRLLAEEGMSFHFEKARAGSVTPVASRPSPPPARSACRRTPMNWKCSPTSP